MGRVVRFPALILLFSVFHAEHSTEALKIAPNAFNQVQPTQVAAPTDDASRPSAQLLNANIPFHPFLSDDSSATRPRKLHGRFLHITDLHPDEFYIFDSAVSQFCHRNKPRKEKERAGRWGVPYSDCDSPVALTNLTFEYLQEEWANNIDFVIWTGDSARHDNDNKIPRTPSAIYEMNRRLAHQMSETFPNIPIVPSIGNNDIWPHNVMQPGPNGITNEYSSIWRPFIPFSSYQVFQHGGYFSTEVIPGHVAAISLNTMYWYDANKAVGGCQLHDSNDPGNMQFDWLDVQLQLYRQRGMQVILVGHVPPTPGNYFPDCHFRYGQIAIRYQDTIVGHFFGHMNVDHFFWLDVHDLNMEPTDPSYRVTGKTPLHEYLREDIENLPKHTHDDDYVIVNVGPSIIPAYLPSFRIYQYNITDYAGPKITDDRTFTAEEWHALSVDSSDDDDDWDIPPQRTNGTDDDVKPHPRRRKRSEYSPLGTPPMPAKPFGRDHRHRHGEKPDCSKPENEEKYACRPWGPRHASANSPSRENRLWSLLGYAQYYLPDIGEEEYSGVGEMKKGGGKKEAKKPRFKLEYVTHSVDALRPPTNTTNVTTTEGAHLWKKQKDWIPPVPKHLLPKSLRDPNRTQSKFAPYELEDLTIPNWIALARELGKSKKMWKKFIGFMYMGQEMDDGDRKSVV